MKFCKRETMGIKCKNCGNTKYTFVETTTTQVSMALDLSDEDYVLPEFKHSQVSKLYTLTCCKCGTVYMYNESDYVKMMSIRDKSGIVYAVDDVLEKMFAKGKVGCCNNNIDDENE
jgi:predicted nucleic-acid-binding Zn-ribbon protein